MTSFARLSPHVLAAFALVGATGLDACSGAEPAAGTVAPPYNADLDMKELMEHVMQSGAYGFWKGWGMVYTPEGTFDISPRTEPEWEAVENGAATVIAVTNVLMTEPYVRDPQDEWFKAAKTVADVAKAGKDAAEKHDKQAMYDIGAKLDEACEACHKKFLEK